MVCFQSWKVMKNSFAQRFPLNTNGGRRNKRTLNNFMIWYIIYELAYPRLRDGLQWLHVGIVLTDHIQSTFRKSTWKFFQTKHRHFLLHCSFTFFNSCNSTWWSLSFSILISSTHFSRVGGWQQQSRSGNLQFFSLHTANSWFTFVQGKTNGTVPSLRSHLTCRPVRLY